MNIYELYEGVLGAAGGFEIFLKNARSGSLFLLHFASYTSYFRICEAFRQVLSVSHAYFMNFMKIYEGGVFNGFFGFGLLFPAEVMKLGKWFASWKFINSVSRPLPYPSPDASHPEREKVEMLFCHGWEYFTLSDGMRYARPMVYVPGDHLSREDEKFLKGLVALTRLVGLAAAVLVGFVIWLAFDGGVR